jgi:hypothetical protein
MKLPHQNKGTMFKPKPLIILEKYYKRSVQKVGRATVVDRAVLAYFADGGDQDTNFKPYSTEEEHLEMLEKWMDKVAKYFDPAKSVRMPFGFGFYLLKALEDDDRKDCEAELVAWEREETKIAPGSLLDLISSVNSESAEAIDHSIALLKSDSEENKLRARKEIDEAIDSMKRLKSLIE